MRLKSRHLLNRVAAAVRSAIGIYMDKFRQEHPNATSDEIKRAEQLFSTQTLAQNRFLSGPQGNTIRSLNVVESHLKTMQELSTALGNSDTAKHSICGQLRDFAEETGQAAPTNFDTAKQIVGTEIIKALGVAGAGTQQEREEAGNAFMRARSPQQIEGAINVVQSLLGGQLKGLRKQYIASSTGMPESSFDDMLEPETRQTTGERRRRWKFKGAPPVGNAIEDGHRFKGGDPSDQSQLGVRSANAGALG